MNNLADTPKEEIKMIVENGILKTEHLPAVMKEFRKPIDEAGLQESKGSETQKGYDTLGYGYAWISERLNDVVGFCWRMVDSGEQVKEITSGTGKKMYEVTVDVTLQLGNWRNKEIEEGETLTKSDEYEQAPIVKKKVNYRIERLFEVLAESPVGNGWHKAFSIADARKGARTNGFKKAAGFFGIGNEAYKKSIDEENQMVQQSLTKKRLKKSPTFNSPSKTAPSQAAANLAMVNQKLEALGAKSDEEKILMLKERFNFTAMDMNTLNEKQLKMILAKILQAQKQ